MINVTDYRHATMRCAGCADMAPTIFIAALGTGGWWCKDCLFETLATNASHVLGSQKAGERECTSCGDTIEADYSATCASCADHSDCHYDCSTNECSSCSDEARYCSADCAARNGDRPSCTTCYSGKARYCDANCGLGDGNSLNCDECGNELSVAACAECYPTTQPAVLAAASPTVQPTTTVTDEGVVSIGGTEFVFHD